jgi:hypothetical protein
MIMIFVTYSFNLPITPWSAFGYFQRSMISIMLEKVIVTEKPRMGFPYSRSCCCNSYFCIFVAVEVARNGSKRSRNDSKNSKEANVEFLLRLLSIKPFFATT